MQSSRMVLVFGGSFSPPTLAHEAIIAKCLALPQFDEVWVMPSGDRPDKTIAISDDDRLSMLRLVQKESFADDKRLVISDFELSLPKPSQTYRTVRELAHAFPDATFWFAFGRDSYQSMPSWPHGKDLYKTLRVVLFGDPTPRPPAGKDLLYLALDIKLSEVSSTGARQALANGQSLRGLVSEPVARYLRTLRPASPRV